jgi:hypothetical protein
MQSVIRWLGVQSYSYFLIHNFVIDRTINLVVDGDPSLYALLLPVMIVGTLVLAVLVNYVMPFLERLITGLLQDVDYVLSHTPERQHRAWSPQVGDRVRYAGKEGWTVLKLEKLLDEREFLLCQVSDGQRLLWVNEEDLEPIGNLDPRSEVNRNSTFF